MIEPQKINELVQGILNAMPEGLKQLPNDIQDNLRAALNSAFHKLDLVTREEFDTQVAVLQKTRQKLEELERRLKELESL